MTATTETKFQNCSTSDHIRLIEQEVPQRSVLERRVGIGAFALVASTLATKLAGAGPADCFGFASVMANRFDTITVPVGYNWHIVPRWGDLLWSDAASSIPLAVELAPARNAPSAIMSTVCCSSEVRGKTSS
ncbi:MAG: hypothetical protein ACPGQV_17000 [Alphaproteobacteria bacterium]